MKPYDQPNGQCTIDPISLTGLAVGALGGLGAGAASGAFSGSGGAQTPAAPVAPPTQMAQPVQQPTGQKPSPKSQAPTFLGAAAAPQPIQSGQKTLLGQ